LPPGSVRCPVYKMYTGINRENRKSFLDAADQARSGTNCVNVRTLRLRSAARCCAAVCRSARSQFRAEGEFGNWLLVRPDGYVGAIVTSSHIEALERYLHAVTPAGKGAHRCLTFRHVPGRRTWGRVLEFCFRCMNTDKTAIRPKWPQSGIRRRSSSSEGNGR